MYELVIPTAVAKDVKRLDPPLQRALRDQHLPRLQANPQCGDPLRGALKGIWSYHFRFGATQYRIAYEIVDQAHQVILVMVAKRGDFYEALLRRLGLW